MTRSEIESEWTTAAGQLGLSTARASHGLACVLVGDHAGVRLTLTERPWGISGSAAAMVPAEVSFVACDRDFFMSCQRPEEARIAEEAFERVSNLTRGRPTDPAWRAFVLPHVQRPRSVGICDGSRILLLHGSLPSEAMADVLEKLPTDFELGCWDENIWINVRAAPSNLKPEDAWRMLVHLVDGMKSLLVHSGTKP